MLNNVDLKQAIEVQAIEYDAEVNVAVEPSIDTKTDQVHEDDCELAEEIDLEEFKGKFFPEKHLQELAINFISAREPEIREEDNIENIDKNFPNVEGMIKSVFPQILAEENS